MVYTLPTLVRGFFDGYFTGLLEARLPQGAKREPRLLKQLVAEQYEKVGAAFTQCLLPILLGLNFDSYEAAVADMQARHFSDSTPVKLLLRYACGSKEAFETVTSEYRRQMETLLTGHIQSVEEHIRLRETSLSSGSEDTAKALRATARTVMQAYALGVRAGEKNAIRQEAVFRLMADAAATLLHDEAIDVWKEADRIGLDGVYSRVCRTQDNYETLLSEMSQAYEDLAES